MRKVLAALVVVALAAAGWWALREGGDSTSPLNAARPEAPETTGPRAVGTPVPAGAAPAAPRSGGAVPRVLDMSVPEVPPGALATRVAQLAGRADAGEASAAYEIAELLESCAEAAERASPRKAECSDVSPALLAKRSEYRLRAAGAGDIRAQSTYWAFPPPEIRTDDGTFRNPEKVIEFKSRASGYLVAAADAGSVQAMQALAGSYMEGSLVPQDRVRALAYYLAFVTAAPDRDPGQSARPYYEAGLSPEELERALMLQRQILEGRKR